MEKKQKTRLAERITEAFRKADDKEARSKVIDLGVYMKKKPTVLS